MKTRLNNFYHDNLKRFDGFLCDVFYNISKYFGGRRMYHDIRHIQTEKDQLKMSEWFDNFEKNFSEIKESE